VTPAQPADPARALTTPAAPSDLTEPSGTSRLHRLVRPIGIGLREGIWSVILVAIAIGVWEVVVRVRDTPDYILPPPSAIADEAVGPGRHLLMPAAWTTFQEVLAGLGVATVVGVALAVAVSSSRMLARGLNPLVVASQTIPVIAIAPLFIVWFGFGMKPKVLMAALIAFFPIAINTTAGLNSVERETYHLVRSLSGSAVDMFLKVRVPAALPYFFVGLKQAAVISVIGAIVGEWVGATQGLGPLMVSANAAFDTRLVFAAVVYLAAMGVLMFVLVLILERLVIPWHFLTRGRGSSADL
jgi:ABC-type nitrate/sulfonate/bicarbonate transport system permease component